MVLLIKFRNWVGVARNRHFLMIHIHIAQHSDFQMALPKFCARGQMSPLHPLVATLVQTLQLHRRILR